MREQILVACHDNVRHMDAKKHFTIYSNNIDGQGCEKNVKHIFEVVISVKYLTAMMKCLWCIATIADSNHTIRKCFRRLHHMQIWEHPHACPDLSCHTLHDCNAIRIFFRIYSDNIHYHNIILRYGPLSDLVLYDWPKQWDHKLSPIFKGPSLIVHPVGTESYKIKSMTPGNRVLKVVHVQHLRPYFKRDTPIIEEDVISTEERETAKMQDPALDLQGNPD
ncbi:hypothetical protein NPIL_18611 [Nephila pilipes]|uniref:Uncharacterized protein n=1 Tax=Nephila pilipes TaxID=299642 RepID=A0A8X6TV35_NEPPI|nr:hypothetical protein NPIL_18611 [Nephila pilipes]